MKALASKALRELRFLNNKYVCLKVHLNKIMRIYTMVSTQKAPFLISVWVVDVFQVSES